MTYRRILDLKFRKKVSTLKLERSFPDERQKVVRVALMELPEKTLKKVIRKEKDLEKLLLMKQHFPAKYHFHS